MNGDTIFDFDVDKTFRPYPVKLDWQESKSMTFFEMNMISKLNLGISAIFWPIFQSETGI